MLRMGGVSQVPFSRQAAGVAVLCQDLAVGPEPFQIAHCPVPFQLLSGPGVLPGSLRIPVPFPQGRRHLLIVDMPFGDPVLYPVLGGHSAAEHRSPGRGTHRGSAEIVRKIHALPGKLIQNRRADFPVPRTAHGPVAHVICHYHHNIGMCHLISSIDLSRIYFNILYRTPFLPVNLFAAIKRPV